MYLFLHITITKSYELNPAVIYTKITNNNGKRDSGTRVLL